MSAPLILLAMTAMAITGSAAGWWLHQHHAGRRTGSDVDRCLLVACAALPSLPPPSMLDLAATCGWLEDLIERLRSRPGDASQPISHRAARLIELFQYLRAQCDTAGKQLQQQQQQLESYAADAHTDPLTGVASRQAFEDELTRRAAEFRWHGQPLSVMLLEVDRFAQLSESCGPDASDAILLGVANVISDTTRDIDLVARYDDHRFAALFPNSQVEGALQAARRVAETIEHAWWGSSGETVRISTSIGAAELQYPETGHALLQRARVALHESQKAGGNGIYCHDGHPASAITSAGGKSAGPAAVARISRNATSTASNDSESRAACSRMEFCQQVRARLAEWQPDELPFSVILIKLDHYERIAAVRGQRTGERVLELVERDLHATIGPRDVLARYRDGCFGLLLAHTKQADAISFARHFEQAVARRKLPASCDQFRVSITCGAVEATAGDDSVRMLQRAEAELAQSVQQQTSLRE